MHAAELRKIMKKTNGWFKGEARARIRQSLELLSSDMARIKSLPEAERHEALKLVLAEWTDRRHYALQMGATSYSDPAWAAAAACESWILSTAGFCDSAEQAEVEALVRQLMLRD